MRLIRPSYEIIEQGPGLQGIYDMIELCGKTSYKSEPKGGETAKRFVAARAREMHGAVLEFGTVYLDLRIGSPVYDGEYISKMDTLMFYRKNHYSKVVEHTITINADGFKFPGRVYYITTNYRVLVENNRLDDLKYLCEPTEFHEKRYAVKFITDIGLGREFLRHRVMSMVQESTRYVNYNKEKFGEECTFVIPPWISPTELAEGEKITWWNGDWVDMNKMQTVCYGDPSGRIDVNTWLNSLSANEDAYKNLVEGYNWSPQQARSVLPLATKTEFVLCGFKDAWIHFFRLRSDIAATGKAHPMSIQLANPLRDEFVKRGYITEKDLEKDTFGTEFDVIALEDNLKI